MLKFIIRYTYWRLNRTYIYACECQVTQWSHEELKERYGRGNVYGNALRPLCRGDRVCGEYMTRLGASYKKSVIDRAEILKKEAEENWPRRKR